MQEPQLGHAGGEGPDIAHILAMALADDDVDDGASLLKF
jgi:hypothetical protein